jgi:LysR family transcriptional regulator, pca operon transcriptional activator
MILSSDTLAAKLLNRMSLRNAVIFLAVFEEKSISAAARRVGLTQSAISKKIAELEDMLEASLFTRESGGVRPTLVGLTTYTVCLRMKLVTQDFAKKLVGVQQDSDFRLALGFAPGFYSSKMNKVVSDLAMAFPNATVTVSTLPKSDLINGLRDRTLTMGVGLEPTAVSECFTTIPVPAVKLAALVGSEHPLLHRVAVKPIPGERSIYHLSSVDDLTGFRWVMPPSDEIITKSLQRCVGQLLYPSCFRNFLLFRGPNID